MRLDKRDEQSMAKLEKKLRMKRAQVVREAIRRLLKQEGIEL